MSAPLEVELTVVLHAFEALVPALVEKDVRRALVMAQLADALRDSDVPPPRPEELAAFVAPLDDEGWRRMALLVGALDAEPLREAAAEAAAIEQDVASWVDVGYASLCAELALHTMELLSRSPHRREELARSWLLRQGIAIAGETADESMAALDRLDYARLRNELERARASAEERTEYLRRLQEKADKLLAPRGKW